MFSANNPKRLIMKKILLSIAICASGFAFAQQKDHTYEILNQNTVKAVYFHENGQVKQEGFYKDGKLHGKWTSYDTNGQKVALGEYENGQKSGKWFFWTNSKLAEVDYATSRIANVKNWQNTAVANRN